MLEKNGHLVVEVLQKIRKRTCMVLVTVGHDDTAQLILVFQNIGVIRQHRIGIPGWESSGT